MPKTALKLPVGVDDFKKLITENYLFIDHTLMIHQFIEQGDESGLILRPRRWGKSLTLSMLYYFLDINAQLPQGMFDHLKIATVDDGAFIKKHRGQYPVILISLKDSKNNNFKEFLSSIALLIQRLYLTHEYLLTSDKLSQTQKEIFNLYLGGNCQDKEKLSAAIQSLSMLLFTHFNKPVYILIDEYDTPMNFLFKNENELEKVTQFFKTMLGQALKTNPYLAKGLMTGILRISKNNMLSDLNNLMIHTSLDTKYSEYYGFLEEEVNELFVKCDITKEAEQIKFWYNGYYSGERIVYNPWSIINCLAKNGQLAPYWVLTASDDLIKAAFLNSTIQVKEKFGQLLLGEKIKGSIGQVIRFDELAQSKNANNLWTLLFYAGYLKATEVETTEINYPCKYEIPNEEVKCTYKAIFSEWLENESGNDHYQALLSSLSDGKIKEFMDNLNRFLMLSVSFVDFADENAYHCFVLGLVSGMMHTHEVESNKEHGVGFLDVSLTPRDKRNTHGLILEFKHIKLIKKGKNKETNRELGPDKRLKKLRQGAEVGLAQIESREYQQVFAQPHRKHIESYTAAGIAFLGKNALAYYKQVNLKTKQIISSGYAGMNEEEEETKDQATSTTSLAAQASSVLTASASATFFGKPSFAETSPDFEEDVDDNEVMEERVEASDDSIEQDERESSKINSDTQAAKRFRKD